MTTRALLLLLLPLTALAAPLKGKVAVMDLKANGGADPSLAITLTRLVTAELARAGADEVVSQEAMTALVGYERQRQLAGCGDEDCLTHLATTLDARWLVVGSVDKVGGSLLAQASLVDNARVQVVSRALVRASSAEQLTAQAGTLVSQLLSESATLHLVNQAPGVNVFLDDRFVGKTPLQPVPVKVFGKHQLRAEGADYPPFETEVELVAGRTTRVGLVLERYDALEVEARARRLGALAATAAGLAAGGGAAFFFVRGSGTYQRYAAADPLDVTQAQLDALASSVRTDFGLGYALAGAGAVALGLGVWMFASNPAAERLEAPKVSVGVALVPGGSGLSLSGRF